MRIAYPRLPRPLAEAELQQVSAAYERGGVVEVRQLARYDHERKRPVSTGRIATPDEISDVRKAVLEAVSGWIDRGGVGSSEAEFDNALGVALHRELNILPADAAHEDTWSFLSLVVFPDVAVLRFPQLHRDRLLGTNRNVLRRTWQRQEVLGSLLQRDEGALGEDELVGLFERTALIRNRELVRCVVEAVHSYKGANRSQWARKLYKAVTFQTGARVLDVLDEHSMRELVADLARQALELRDDSDD